MANEEEAAPTCYNTTREAHRHQCLQPSTPAHRACESAMTRYTQLALLLQLLRNAFLLCSPCGRLHTAPGVRTTLKSLLSRIEALEEAGLPNLLQALRFHKE